MSQHITRFKLTRVMRTQIAIWEDRPDAVAALEDTVHYLANILGLSLRTKMGERRKFFAECGSDFYLRRELVSD